MCPQFTLTHSGAIWSIAAVFVCCAALRLARFNVEMDSDDDHTVFAGLPTPAAAATIGSFALLSYFLRNEVAVVTHENFVNYDWWMQRTLPFFAIIIALLMVSRIPYPHPLTQFVRGQKSFAHLVAIVFALMVIQLMLYMIPLFCVLFVLIPPVRYAWNHLWHRRTRRESLF
jgi:CDP-diacylglycerol--serine O-phosphatidyltransferase